MVAHGESQANWSYQAAHEGGESVFEKYNQARLVDHEEPDPAIKHAAFHSFYDECDAVLRSVLRRMAYVPSDQEDILQKAYVAIWQSFTGLPFEKEEILPWAIAILRRTSVDHYRSNTSLKRDTRLTECLADCEILPDPRPSDQEPVDIKDLLRAAHFEGIQRIVFDMSLLGFSLDEIAAELGVNEKTVRRQKAKIGDKVAKVLGHDPRKSRRRNKRKSPNPGHRQESIPESASSVALQREEGDRRLHGQTRLPVEQHEQDYGQNYRRTLHPLPSSGEELSPITRDRLERSQRHLRETIFRMIDEQMAVYQKI